jgi:hypothetical protein
VVPRLLCRHPAKSEIPAKTPAGSWASAIVADPNSGVLRRGRWPPCLRCAAARSAHRGGALEKFLALSLPSKSSGHQLDTATNPNPGSHLNKPRVTQAKRSRWPARNGAAPHISASAPSCTCRGRGILAAPVLQCQSKTPGSTERTRLSFRVPLNGAAVWSPFATSRSRTAHPSIADS